MKTNIHKGEEKLNAISHAVGILLSVIGFVLLLNKNTNKTIYSTNAIVIYSVSIIVLYTASTMYHMANGPKRKSRLRIFDHVSIYFLIAGTYTPVTLITLEQGQGWFIFYIIWTIAIIGTLFKLFFTGKFEILSLALYLIMGWLIVFDFNSLWNQISEKGKWLFFLGGAFYTFGIIFYAFKKIPYNHLIWHFFVLSGSISHWLFIYNDVV